MGVLHQLLSIATGELIAVRCITLITIKIFSDKDKVKKNSKILEDFMEAIDENSLIKIKPPSSCTGSCSNCYLYNKCKSIDHVKDRHDEITYKLRKLINNPEEVPLEDFEKTLDELTQAYIKANHDIKCCNDTKLDYQADIKDHYHKLLSEAKKVIHNSDTSNLSKQNAIQIKESYQSQLDRRKRPR